MNGDSLAPPQGGEAGEEKGSSLQNISSIELSEVIRGHKSGKILKIVSSEKLIAAFSPQD
ncbi:hypothetical protein SK128_009289 [Halocaridina rubra]|uniref:Uncharacterized protein n=1 Tax=Halocaridina rubra TaxID=373956 RepID=A0AAN8WSR7_HALRR